MRRKRKLSSTSSDRLARRNLTSTSPLLTRADEEAAVVVMVKDVHPTGSAAKVRRVNAAHQGNPGSQDQMERKASSSRGEGEVREAEVAAVEREEDVARAVDVVMDVPVEAAASPAENSASTKRLSPPWGNE